MSNGERINAIRTYVRGVLGTSEYTDVIFEESNTPPRIVRVGYTPVYYGGEITYFYKILVGIYWEGIAHLTQVDEDTMTFLRTNLTFVFEQQEYLQGAHTGISVMPLHINGRPTKMTALTSAVCKDPIITVMKKIEDIIQSLVPTKNGPADIVFYHSDAPPRIMTMEKSNNQNINCTVVLVGYYWEPIKELVMPITIFAKTRGLNDYGEEIYGGNTTGWKIDPNTITSDILYDTVEKIKKIVRAYAGASPSTNIIFSQTDASPKFVLGKGEVVIVSAGCYWAGIYDLTMRAGVFEQLNAVPVESSEEVKPTRAIKI
jgi:hypothetical protein